MIVYSLLDSPSFDGEDNDFVRHNKAGQAHSHIESEHGIKIVPVHDFHDILSLPR